MSKLFVCKAISRLLIRQFSKASPSRLAAAPTVSPSLSAASHCSFWKDRQYSQICSFDHTFAIRSYMQAHLGAKKELMPSIDYHHMPINQALIAEIESIQHRLAQCHSDSDLKALFENPYFAHQLDKHSDFLVYKEAGAKNRPLNWLEFKKQVSGYLHLNMRLPRPGIY
jgi:hypothetical protein